MSLEIQKSILVFFSNIQNPVLNAIGEFFTLFGEELIPLALGLFIFWCIDKKKGFASCLIMVVTNTLMNLLKCIIRFPRPWVVYPELNTLRISTATGYSFPSGHTSCASCFYSSLAVGFKKKWLSIICAFLIFMVGLSRLYLCCHWPQDVLCGYILGISVTLFSYSRIGKLFDDKEKCLKLMPKMGIVVFVIGLVISILLQTEKVDYQAFSDFSKAIALLGGMLICYPIELKHNNFSVLGKLGTKVIRYLVGMVGALFFMVGIKILLPYVPVISYIRYTLVASWACLYPMLGKKLGLFD